MVNKIKSLNNSNEKIDYFSVPSFSFGGNVILRPLPQRKSDSIKKRNVIKLVQTFIIDNKK